MHLPIVPIRLSFVHYGTETECHRHRAHASDYYRKMKIFLQVIILSTLLGFAAHGYSPGNYLLLRFDGAAGELPEWLQASLVAVQSEEKTVRMPTTSPVMAIEGPMLQITEDPLDFLREQDTMGGVLEPTQMPLFFLDDE